MFLTTAEQTEGEGVRGRLVVLGVTQGAVSGPNLYVFPFMGRYLLRIYTDILDAS